VAGHKVVDRAQLMARAQKGDREAFHTLFKDIGPFITRSLRQRLPGGEVEDICQEMLIAVYKSRHTYQSHRPFELWLFAIIQNVTGKYLDHNHKRQRVEAQLDEFPDVSIEGGSGLELDLRAALEQLPLTQLQALALTKVLGLSIADVQGALDEYRLDKDPRPQSV
jgi:DNA-directed RNA polymerase specialized sigma24 family protein